MRAWLTPNTPSGDTVRRVLHIPVEYLSSVNGALEELTDTANWEQYGTETPEAAAAAMQEMLEDYYVSYVTSDTAQRTGVLHPYASLSGSSAQTVVMDGSCINNCYWNFTTPVDGNHIDYTIVGPNGYKFDLIMWVNKRNTGGLLLPRLDGVALGSAFDLYNATVNRNNVAAWTNFTISGDGEHDLSIAIAGKNPASGSYQMEVIDIAWRVRMP